MKGRNQPMLQAPGQDMQGMQNTGAFGQAPNFKSQAMQGMDPMAFGGAPQQQGPLGGDRMNQFAQGGKGGEPMSPVQKAMKMGLLGPDLTQLLGMQQSAQSRGSKS